MDEVLKEAVYEARALSKECSMIADELLYAPPHYKGASYTARRLCEHALAFFQCIQTIRKNVVDYNPDPRTVENLRIRPELEAEFARERSRGSREDYDPRWSGLPSTPRTDLIMRLQQEDSRGDVAAAARTCTVIYDELTWASRLGKDYFTAPYP